MSKDTDKFELKCLEEYIGSLPKTTAYDRVLAEGILIRFEDNFECPKCSNSAYQINGEMVCYDCEIRWSI